MSNWQLAPADLTGSCVCVVCAHSTGRRGRGWCDCWVAGGARFLDLHPLCCHLVSLSRSAPSEKRRQWYHLRGVFYRSWMWKSVVYQLLRIRTFKKGLLVYECLCKRVNRVGSARKIAGIVPNLSLQINVSVVEDSNEGSKDFFFFGHMSDINSVLKGGVFNILE